MIKQTHVNIDSHRRSFLKSLSWRVMATVLTTCVAWSITENIRFAATIGILDSLVKFVIYYLHERIWNKVSFGRLKPPEYDI